MKTLSACTILVFFKILSFQILYSEEFDLSESAIPAPIFATNLWNHFSVEKISNPKLRETMRAIFQYRENAKLFILQAEELRKALPDKAAKQAITGAISGVIAATLSGNLTTILIGAGIGALANVATCYYNEIGEIRSLLEMAKMESEKADLLEQYVLVNACIS